MTSPLPTEILIHIFDVYFDNVDEKNLWLDILPLCLVCTRWREIAVSHPRLWSTIYISLFTYPPEHILALWLERSRTAPLNIIVRAGDEYDPKNNISKVIPLLKILGDRVHQWQSFEIDLRDSLIGLVGSNPFSTALQLRTLKVMAHSLSYRSNEKLVSALAVTPSLNSLAWTSDSRSAQPMIRTFQFQRLTRIDLKFSMASFDIVQVMYHCTSVTHMRIIAGHPATSPTTPLSVSLPHLQNLHLSTAFDYEILNRFDFPNLHTLVLSKVGFWPTYNEDITPLSHFLVNVRPSLRILSLTDYDLKLEKLPEFLSSYGIANIPILEILTRRPTEDIQALMRRAAETRANHTVVPPLEIYTLMRGYVIAGWVDTGIYKSLEDHLLDFDVKLRIGVSRWLERK